MADTLNCKCVDKKQILEHHIGTMLTMLCDPLWGIVSEHLVHGTRTRYGSRRRDETFAVAEVPHLIASRNRIRRKMKIYTCRGMND